MRYTLDTNIITIRDVFAMNSKSGAVIETDSFPVIGSEGQLTWNSPSEFLGGISCMNTTVLGLLETIQPGFSTLSTNFSRVRDFMLVSTIDGTGHIYVSSLGLMAKVRELTIEHGYISTTSFYDCVSGLSRLNTITQNVGPMVTFLSAIGSNFARSGYISTINPGGFHNYYSTLGFTGGLTNATVNSGTDSMNINLGGFEVLPYSKIRLDINANVSVNYLNPPQPQSIVTAFSTFLHNGTRPIGTPVVVMYSNLDFAMSKFTYFLTGADLSSTSLGLRHRIINFDNTNATITVVPTSVHVRFINMD
jgi:hypothetical protein